MTDLSNDGTSRIVGVDGKPVAPNPQQMQQMMQEQQAQQQMQQAASQMVSEIESELNSYVVVRAPSMKMPETAMENRQVLFQTCLQQVKIQQAQIGITANNRHADYRAEASIVLVPKEEGGEVVTLLSAVSPLDVVNKKPEEWTKEEMLDFLVHEAVSVPRVAHLLRQMGFAAQVSYRRDADGEKQE